MKGIDKGSIDKIVGKYQGLREKKWDDRIKAFDKFYTDRKENASGQFDLLAHNIHLGPEGAYHAGYKKLDGVTDKLNEKIKDEDKLAEVLEAYVDSALEKIHPDYKKTIEEHKRTHNLDAKAMRKLKGSLYGVYHVDNEGRALNPLNDAYIKQFKNKTKIEAAQLLRALASNSHQMYAGYLEGKATDGLIKREDHLQFAPHFQKQLDAAGYEHEDHALTRSFEENLRGYSTLIHGGELAKLGYRRKAPPEEHAAAAAGGHH